MSPVCPSSITSGRAPTSVPTTGLPYANDCRTAYGVPSICRLGRTVAIDRSRYGSKLTSEDRSVEYHFPGGEVGGETSKVLFDRSITHHVEIRVHGSHRLDQDVQAFVVVEAPEVEETGSVAVRRGGQLYLDVEASNGCGISTI